MLINKLYLHLLVVGRSSLSIADVIVSEQRAEKNNNDCNAIAIKGKSPYIDE